MGKFQICLDMPSIKESTSYMACGERAMRQRVCEIFELAPYSKRRCFMWRIGEYVLVPGQSGLFEI